MAAGNVSDAVGLGDNGQAEGERGQQIAGSGRGITSHKHSGTAAESDQDGCSDKFSEILFHNILQIPIFVNFI